MSDEPISKAPAQDMTSTDIDTETTGGEIPSPQIFDITPDLNISPAKDEIENPSTTPIPDNILGQQTQQQQNTISSISQKEIDSIGISIIPTKTDTETENTLEISSNQKTESRLPLQPQFGPANPPAKTIGMKPFGSISTQQETKNEPSSLQEAISSIKIETEIPKKPFGNSSIPSKPIIVDRPWETKPNSIIKPLRTYETDFAEAMSKKRISTSSFVIAEDKKRQIEKDLGNFEKSPTSGETTNKINTRDLQNTQFKSHTTRNWILSIVSLILICGGGFAGYYLYLRSPVAPVVIQNSGTDQAVLSKSIIPSDSKVILNIDNKNANKILSEINSEIAKQQNEKTIKEIILSKTTPTGTKKVGATEMLSLAEIPAPDLFARSLSADWMLGVYTNPDGLKNPFVISTNIFFQNTFAGIIQWERTMPDDLKQYLYSGTIPTSTTSDIVVPDFTTRGQFKDRIIKNRDVREYIAENGHIIFLYSFISNDKLVITNSEQALEEIISRLEKNAFVR